VEGVQRRGARGDGVIDSFLADLRRALRSRLLLRRRLLAEVEGHLRESAEELRRSGRPAEDAEREAVARFGSPEGVAAAAVRAAWPRSLVPAALLLLGALMLHVLPPYGIPENTLPRAPWATRPGYLTWKLYASLGAYGVSLGAVLLAAGAAWRGWARVALGALATSLTAFAVSAALGVALAVQWAGAVPGSGTALALSLPATALTTGLAALAVVVAALHAPRLLPEPPPKPHGR
jgi:hypothetical protein